MDDNTEYTATSSMIVDLSGDNDNIGAITAANSLPKTPDDSPFERSCDNPECSAPKLISLVPKRETAEFITEPMVINQPTLVNGFTTVFQVDGLAAKMNDIMNGNFGEAASEGFVDQSKPKTVFRIVPNTHAHIVNYVVVDGAGETMRKIKSNDPVTMQKLLDSQRLSAEQMLRKLISKAFKKNPEPEVPLPIASKVPGYTHLGAPLQSTANAGAGPLPTVPTGITITPVDPIQVPESPLVINISPKLPTRANTASSLKENAAPKLSVGTSKLADLSVKPQRKVLPRGIATKDTPPKFILPQVSTPKAATLPKVTPVANMVTPKPAPAITTPVKTMTLAVTTAPTPTSTSATLSLLKPGPGTAATVTPTKPTAVAGASVKPTPSPTVTCSTSATLSSAPKKSLQTLPTETTKTVPNILKRKHPTDTPDAVKRLRPRSPKQKAPMAVGLEPSSKFPSPTRKLPTLPKLPTKPPAARNPSSQSIQPPKKAPAFDDGFKSHVDPVSGENLKEAPKSRSLEIAKAFASCLAEPEKSISSADVPNKVATVRSLAAKVSAALAVNSGVTKIGETFITPAVKTKEERPSTSQVKESPADEPSTSKKVEEASSNTTLASATSKPTASPHSTAVLTTISKLTSSGPKIIAQTKTNLEPIKETRQSSSPEKDPLALDDLEKSIAISSKPISLADTIPVTRLLTKSTFKDSATSVQTVPTLSEAKLRSKSQVTTPMTTRGSAPKTATPTAAVVKQDKILSAMPTRTLRVMLPALKSGVLTLPVRSPHPNLKISSVISGSAVAETLKTNRPKTPTSEETSSDIDRLQQELADLKRTVERLSRKKT